ncbi:MAG: alpha/beta hydrolase [Chloroflexi bacterium]|nr:alpha/beta hydrolase [Chloroflexota bacterium]
MLSKTRIAISVCVLLSLVLGGALPVVGPARTAQAQGVSEPFQFQPGPCLFEMPDGLTEGDDIECGTVTVPELHAQPDGATIDLAVAVIKSTSASPAPDPVVYLEGGPGGNALEGMPTSYPYIYAPFRDERDVIVFDQRGTGFSVPLLDCQEYDDLFIATLPLDMTNEEYQAGQIEAFTQCRDRLVSDGVNLAAYNSAENAADLNAIRQALGYEQWNLFGISYGTRLALTAMRDQPDGIRSVILDSTLPLQADLYLDLIAHADAAFATLFDACAANPDCNQSYPNLEQTFFDLVQRLDENPVTIPVIDLIDGVQYDVLIDGDLMINVLFQLLYVTELLPYLPRIVNDASSGNYQLLAIVLGAFLSLSESISEGMQFSVQCAEEAAFVSAEQAAEAAAEHPAIGATFDLDNQIFFLLCSTWGAAAVDGIENEPVVSDIPTPVLAGEYDPITPPAYGRLAAETLDNGYFFLFPGMGHGIVPSAHCAQQIALDFLEVPQEQPDASCIANMEGPAFFTQ